MRRIGRRLLETILFVLVLSVLGGLFWMGLVPQRYSPFLPISLDQRPLFFTDLRLAFLRHDVELCRSVVKGPHTDAAPVADQKIVSGCGWTNSYRMQTAGGARIGVDKLTCEMTAAITLWVEYEVQPAAVELFGKRVSSIEDMGTYSCRNIIGSKFFKNRRSQHATANAIDISAFTLEDGRRISILKNWKGSDTEARFLHRIHSGSCRYFRAALGPNFNKEHSNHFHFDRGIAWLCR